MTDVVNRRLRILFYTGLFVVFGVLRFHALSDRPMHNDEGVNGFFSNNLLKSNTYKYDPTNYHGPSLYYIQAAVSFFWGFVQNPVSFNAGDTNGLTVASARFTTVAVGLLVLLSFFLLKEYLGAWGLLISLLFAGLSASFLFYSRYFIHETLVVFFTLWIFLGAWRYSCSKNPFWAICSFFSLVLLLSTKETGIIHAAVLALAAPAAVISRALLNKEKIGHVVDLEKKSLAEFFYPLRPYVVRTVFAGAIVWVLLFTSFFKNWGGIKDAFAAYVPWLHQGIESGHEKSIGYFFSKLLAPYEPGLVVFAVFGAAIALIKRDLKGLYLTYWFAGVALAYSAIPYKTPWLVVNIVLPMTLLAGWGVQAAVTSMASFELETTRTRAAIFLTGALCLALAFPLPKMWRLNYVEWDDPKHPHIYVHTSRDVFKLIATLDELARRSGKGRDLLIQFFTPQYWPIPFYMKDFREAKFWGKLTPVDNFEAPVIVAAFEQHSELRRMLTAPYSVQTFALRPGYYLDIWTSDGFTAGFEPSTIPLPLHHGRVSAPVRSGLRRSLFAGADCSGKPVSSSLTADAPAYFYDADVKKPLPPPFCVEWNGFLKIPSSGVYRILLNVDDGGVLEMDGQTVIDNRGPHSALGKSAILDLNQGFHAIKLTANDIGGFAELGLYWAPAGGVLEEIPASAFFVE